MLMGSSCSMTQPSQVSPAQTQQQWCPHPLQHVLASHFCHACRLTGSASSAHVGRQWQSPLCSGVSWVSRC